MKLHFLVAGLAILTLTACGVTEGERAGSGAAIGAVAGLPLGPAGVAVGAGVGAATGALTESDDVYLGEPLWER